MKKIIAISTLLIFSFCTMAQEPNPTWIKRMPNIKGNFQMKVIIGRGTNPVDARANAMYALINQINQEKGVFIKGQSDIDVSLNSINGISTEKNNHNFSYVIDAGSEKVAFSIQDEFTKGNNHYMLIEVANDHNNPQFKNLVLTNEYNIFAKATSIIIPGLGQRLKGDPKKGNWFFWGEVGVFALTLSSTALFDDLSDTAPVAVAVGGTLTFAAIHIWNIIDAFTAPGARRVSVYQTNKLYKSSVGLSKDMLGLSYRIDF